MVTSCTDLRLAQQMDPRSMSVDLSREGDEYVPEATCQASTRSPSSWVGGQPLTVRAVSGSVRDRRREVVHRRTAPHGQFMRLLGLAPGIDSDSVTASCDPGALRVVMHSEQPAVRKYPPEPACS